MLYVLLAIAGLISWFALRNKASLLGLLSGGAWFVILAYIAEYPPGNLTQGDTIHNMLLLVLGGVAVAMPLITFSIAKASKYNVELGVDVEGRKVFGSATEDLGMAKSTRHGWGGDTYNESADEYQQRIHSVLHPKRKRR